jgi:hypothetical protein
MKDYIINTDTLAVHDTMRMNEQCNIDDMTHKKYVDIWQFLELVADGYSPCKHCWPDE